MTPTATGLMTAEEFMSLVGRPANAGRRLELDRGRVVEMPSPGRFHGTVCGLIARLLGNHLFARGGGSIATNDAGLIVQRQPDTVRGPDLAVYLTDTPLDQITRKASDDIPVLVVEVMSPSDSHPRTTRRIGQYLTRGVPLVWVVDAEARVVYVYKANEFTKVLEGDEELTGNGVVPDFACKVSDLFALPAAPPAA